MIFMGSNLDSEDYNCPLKGPHEIQGCCSQKCSWGRVGHAGVGWVGHTGMKWSGSCRGGVG